MKRIVFLLLCGFAAFLPRTVRAEIDVAAAWAQLPRPVTSSGGFVKVFAYDDLSNPVGFRGPILGFVTRTVQKLTKAYKLEIQRGEAGIIVYAMTGTTNDTRVITRTFRRGEGLVTKIWLPSPGFSDLETFEFEIARAFFRSWLDQTARAYAAERLSTSHGRKSPSPAELPDWVVQGALRAADISTARADTYFVLRLWSEAKLPFFPAVCTDLRYARGPAAALSGYLVSWTREKHMFSLLLNRLAEGTPWNGAWLAEKLTEEKDPVLQDRASDERFARLTRGCLTPGQATDWDLLVFTSRLLLYPPVFGKNDGTNWASCTFREAVRRAETDPNVREAALRKIREVPFCAIGRGEELSDVAVAYVRFLTALARGDDSGVLLPLLEEADGKLKSVLKERSERGTQVSEK